MTRAELRERMRAEVRNWDQKTFQFPARENRGTDSPSEPRTVRDARAQGTRPRSWKGSRPEHDHGEPEVDPADVLAALDEEAEEDGEG